MTPEQRKQYKKRRREVVRMHDRKKNPLTFKQIGVLLHITTARAHQLYHFEKNL